jgi:hypothetical protein
MADATICSTLRAVNLSIRREALGLPTEALQKIDELVDGRGLSRDGRRIKWQTMRDAANDLETTPSARGLFGPGVRAELRNRVLALQARHQADLRPS